MAHPHVELVWQAGQQRRFRGAMRRCAGPYSRSVPGTTLPAELMREQLHAVADPEDRQAGIEDPLRAPAALHRRRRCRAAGEDDAAHIHPRDAFRGRIEREELAVRVQFAHPPRDEHAELRTKSITTMVGVSLGGFGWRGEVGRGVGGQRRSTHMRH